MSETSRFCEQLASIPRADVSGYTPVLIAIYEVRHPGLYFLNRLDSWGLSEERERQSCLYVEYPEERRVELDLFLPEHRCKRRIDHLYAELSECGHRVELDCQHARGQL